MSNNTQFLGLVDIMVLIAVAFSQIEDAAVPVTCSLGEIYSKVLNYYNL